MMNKSSNSGRVNPVCAELSWRLAAGSGPPGGSEITEGSQGLVRLAAGSGPPGGSEITEGSQGLVRLAAGVVPPGGTCSEGNFMALCSWRYATPTRRSGS
ncbi:hypothetical protein DEO72_LG6g77 [Vigna unguiculata]|uniref:Uncharacterized protein n=1 Tax=Vigna unguiculata TaxID=3917 RepID=A0A4D6M2Q1_VIGUN|nr:hypothetical protein DEO72_LG6g77 [Vigna unguiculata]